MDELAALNLGGRAELDLALHNDGRDELSLGPPAPTTTQLHRTLMIIIIIMMVMIF